MRNTDSSGVPGKEGGSGARICPECGERVENNFRFCSGCGSFIPDDAPGSVMNRDRPGNGRPTEGRQEPFPRQDVPYYRQEGADDGAVSISMPIQPLHSSVDRAGTSFRQFNAAIRDRRERRDRQGGIFLIVLFLMFVAALGGGVYWFLHQAEQIPWDSDVVRRPAVEPARPASDGKNADAPPPATPGGSPETRAVVPQLPASPAVQADVLEISRPTKGVVLGSNVNLRGSHSVTSPVVGKVSTGNEVEVLESWTSDEGAEVVALVDVELTAADGKTVRITRGRGVSVLSGPDSRGMLRVALPEDRAKTPYTVAASNMSNPHSWPWYRIRPRSGKEGWIFGKFITVLNPRDNTLSATFLDRSLSSFGSTREQLVAALGTPRKTASRKVTVSGAPVDEVTLTFDGAVAVLLEKSPSSEVKSLTITSAGKSLDGGLATGIDRRAVLSILGLPNALDKGNEVYRADAGHGIRIRYENYTVRTIHVGSLN